MQADKAARRLADLVNRHGGVMRIRRAIIVPVILALGVTGSILSGSAMAAAAAHAPSVQVHATANSMKPNMYYHD